MASEMTNALSKVIGYRPRLLTYIVPAYCAEKSWIVTYDEAGIAKVRYIERVERRWKDDERSNGNGPCLLFVAGEPKPWYFDSGHEHVSVLSQDHRSDD